MFAVCRFKIVGQRDFLDPVRTLSDATYGPRAAADVASIAQLDAGRDRRVIWLAAYVQAAAGGRAFEFAGARFRLAWTHPGPLWKKWRCANLFLLSRKVHRAPPKY